MVQIKHYCSMGVRSKDLFLYHWVNTFYEYRSISFLAGQGLEKLAAMILLSTGITSFAIKLHVSFDWNWVPVDRADSKDIKKHLCRWLGCKWNNTYIFSLPQTFLALHHAFLPRERPLGRVNLVPRVLSYSSLGKRGRTVWRAKRTLRGRPFNGGPTVLI